MLTPNHPQDERLSGLAARDPDAIADAALAEHVATCERCTDAVAELRALLATLAELPDLRPHRPLRLLPEVADPAPSRVDRLGGWARRFFAPALAAGAAVAMVGLVGTASPMLSGLGGASSGAAPQENAYQDSSDPSRLSAASAPAGAEGFAEPTAETFTGGDGSEAGADDATDDGTRSALDDADGRPQLGQEDASGGAEDLAATAERSPWPMVLFSGVAIMIAAALLRWILVPRAG